MNFLKNPFFKGSSGIIILGRRGLGGGINIESRDLGLHSSESTPRRSFPGTSGFLLVYSKQLYNGTYIKQQMFFTHLRVESILSFRQSRACQSAVLLEGQPRADGALYMTHVCSQAHHPLNRSTTATCRHIHPPHHCHCFLNRFDSNSLYCLPPRYFCRRGSDFGLSEHQSAL